MPGTLRQIIVVLLVSSLIVDPAFAHWTSATSLQSKPAATSHFTAEALSPRHAFYRSALAMTITVTAFLLIGAAVHQTVHLAIPSTPPLHFNLFDLLGDFLVGILSFALAIGILDSRLIHPIILARTFTQHQRLNLADKLIGNWYARQGIPTIPVPCPGPTLYDHTLWIERLLEASDNPADISFLAALDEGLLNHKMDASVVQFLQRDLELHDEYDTMPANTWAALRDAKAPWSFWIWPYRSGILFSSARARRNVLLRLWFGREDLLEDLHGTDAEKAAFLIRTIATRVDWDVRRSALHQLAKIIQPRIQSGSMALDNPGRQRMVALLINELMKDKDWRNRLEAWNLIAPLVDFSHLAQVWYEIKREDHPSTLARAWDIYRSIKEPKRDDNPPRGAAPAGLPPAPVLLPEGPTPKGEETPGVRRSIIDEGA